MTEFVLVGLCSLLRVTDWLVGLLADWLIDRLFHLGNWLSSRSIFHKENDDDDMMTQSVCVTLTVVLIIMRHRFGVKFHLQNEECTEVHSYYDAGERKP